MMEWIAAERRSRDRLATLPDGARRFLDRHRRRHLSLLGLAAFLIATVAVVQTEGIFLSRELIFLWILAGLLAVSLADIGGFFRGAVVDWLPFFGALFVYDFLRGLADGALFQPHLLPQIRFDEALFGGEVPTVWLQQRLFDPASIQWYDFAAWAVYLTHFFAVFVIAAYLWKTQRPRFLRFRNMVLTVTGAAFLTYLLFPAVPPWLASDSGAIGESGRVVGAIWGDLGITPAVAIWEQGSSFANEVAAVPSLHTAYPVLIMLFLWSGCRRWSRVALLGYALAMSLTLVYTAEHYVADVLLGWLYAGAAYLLVTRLSDGSVDRRLLGRPNWSCYIGAMSKLAGRTVKVKKKCCKSKPRCKKCPAAMRALERRGLAERTGKRSYRVSLDATKKDLKAARRR